MKKYLQTFALVSCLSFHACFFLLLIGNNNGETILPYSKKEPIENKQTSPVMNENPSEQISSLQK